MSERLVERGAELIDADAIVRRLQEPGQPVFAAMVERWGDGIVAPDGTLDRAAVAAIVFADDAELKAIEAIVHPEVGKEMRRRMDEAADGDHVVILDIPLLAESRSTGGGHLDARGASAIIVVDCPIDTAVERLMEFRGFSADDARARIAKQASREERVALADFVVDNSGDLEALDAEVDRCWDWLSTLAPTPWPPPAASPPTASPPAGSEPSEET